MQPQETNKEICCQSCGMPLTEQQQLGTNADGSTNPEYCKFCFTEGAFVQEATMDEMIEICIPFVSKGNPFPDPETARKAMQEYFPKLKRWKK